MSSSTPATTTIPPQSIPTIMTRTNTTPNSLGTTEGALLEPVYQVKLLAALRSGDPALIHPFLTEIGKDRRASLETSTGGIDTAAAALHLAVRCASIQTVQLLLSHRAISPNGIHPPGSGATSLHLASSLGRADIVSLLLDQENIDDTIRDARGRTCRDVARSKDVIKLIDDSRSFLNASYRSLLRSYILSPPSESPSPALITLLSSPRASLVDLSYLDDASGLSVLHEAAKRKDLRLIELAVRAGADVFVRNRRGKMALDSAGKDDKVRVFLRQFANHDRSLIQTPASTTEPPTLKGYLNKYTNVARGYSTRWFVLTNGVLSYYRHQDDENITSRGSISMKNAHLKTSISGNTPHQQQYSSTPNSTSSSSKSSSLRFEIHSLPSTNPSSSSQQQKWYIKANHPTEAARWITAIRASMEWSGGGATPNLTVAGVGAVVGAEVEMARRTSGESFSDSRSVYSFAKLKKPQLVARTSMGPSLSTSVSGAGGGGGDADSINLAGVNSAVEPNLSDFGVFPSGGIGSGAGTEGEEEEEEDMETSSAETGTRGHGQVPPYEGEYEIAANSVVVQLEAVQQLVAGYLSSTPTTSASGAGVVVGVGPSSSVLQSLAPPPAQTPHAPVMALSPSLPRSITPSSGVSSSSKSSSHKSAAAPSLTPNPPASHLAPPNTAISPLPSASSSPVPSASTTTHPHESLILTSLSQLSSLLNTHLNITSSREEWYKKSLRSERRRQSVWEESLKIVVREGEMLESELRERRRRRGSGSVGVSEFGSVGVGVSLSSRKRRETIKAMGRPVVGGGVPEEVAIVGEGGGQLTSSPTPQARSFVPPSQQPRQLGQTESGGTMDTIRVVSHSPSHSPQLPQSQSRPQPQSPPPQTQVRFRQVQKAEEEEDYDDSEDEFFDAIESNNLPGLIIPAPLSKPLSSPAHLPPYISMAPYSGYKQLRTQLEISDERPPTSLWSVLKNSIGKDLTRISFPVSFNEPTSMLQRMAEDMEFSECLDTAATQRDSLKRLAFVAAFAMSNYSSTIGRIAKPFNPMLSETFEYVRMDKKYRYVSEQVSHHPPISACWAESPLWSYFGEVDAQNKFMGKSFEIRPTGVAHAELLLPESWVPTSSSGRRKQQYPKAEGTLGEGKVREHYTWKKVTTNISGFILGSPTINHYGDMTITNHRTSERCILTFKPRGWRGKDAYEISGQVMDASGRTVYEIAGRWNSQLIMREVGDGHTYDEALNPDTTISSPTSPTGSIRSPGSSTLYDSQSRLQSYSHTHGDYILLWKNSTKPPGSPFNLTPFAITLNDCPPSTLRPYLPPSDCRLRPDQRAFELGKYDLANTLKLDQEEKQRKTRREREMGVREGHRPRWFESRTCGDTGERVWMPKKTRVRVRRGEDGGGSGGGDYDVVEGEGEKKGVSEEEEKVEYWVERERVWKEVEEVRGGSSEEVGSGKVVWKGVEEIFIDEPEVIRELCTLYR